MSSAISNGPGWAVPPLHSEATPPHQGEQSILDNLERLHSTTTAFEQKVKDNIASGAELSGKYGLTLDAASSNPEALEQSLDTFQKPLDWTSITRQAPVTVSALETPELMIAGSPYLNELVSNEKAWGEWSVPLAPDGRYIDDRFTWGRDVPRNMQFMMGQTLNALDRTEREGLTWLLDSLRDDMRARGYSDELLARVEAGEDIDLDAERLRDSNMISPFVHRQFTRALNWLLEAGQSDALKLPVQDEEQHPWMRAYAYRKSAYASGAQQFVADVAGAAPSMFVAGTGNVLGGALGGLGALGATIFGMTVNELEKDPAVDKDRIYSAAWINALLQAPLEAIGFKGIMKAFKPVSSWGKAVKAWGSAGTGEGATEYLQSYPETLAHEYARGLDPLEPEDAEQLLSIYLSGAFQKDALYQGAVGAAAGLGFASPGLYSNYRAAQRDALIKTASAEMGRKYPEAYERILTAQTEAGVVPEQVFVPVARLEGLFQSDSTADPAAIMAEVGIDPVDFETAKQSGATIAVPFAKIHKLTALDESILPYVQMTPEQEQVMAAGGAVAEAVTNMEAAEVYQTPEEQAALDELMGRSLVDEELQAARAEMKRALTEASRHTDYPLTTEQAGVYTDLADKIAHTWAANTGRAPIEWYRTYAPEFLGPFATVEDLEVAKARAKSPFFAEPRKWGKEQDAAFKATVREEGAEAAEQAEMLRGMRNAPLKDRLPWLGHIWGRLDGKSLKRDYPDAYREILSAHGRGVFRSAENGGLPADYLAAELVENRLFQDGMGADDLVEMLKRPRDEYDILYQPLNPGVDLDAPVPVVSVQPQFEGVEAWKLSKGAITKDLKKLAGTYTNDATGWDIEVTGKGIAHSAGTVAKRQSDQAAHMEAVANLPSLIKNAQLVESHADRKGQGHSQVHRMYAGMAIGGDLYTVKLTVKEILGQRRAEIDGIYRLYDSSIEKKTSDGAALAAIPEGWGANSTSDAFNTVTLRQLLEGVNDSTGQSFLQAGQGQARAAIMLQEGMRPIIQLFQSANISSAAHEMAHLLRRQLEDMASLPGVSQRVLDDWLAANDFVGAKAGETWTEAQEEQFADAFLDYLERGEAPTKGLRKLFRTFARWFSRLYQTITRHGVQVSPEMRGVFDRLLVTEAEIERAKARAEATPALSDIMVPETRREQYRKALEGMNDAAATEIEKKLLTELARRQSQWEKEGKKLADESQGHVILDSIVDGGGIRLTEELRERLLPEAIQAIQEKRPRKKVFVEEGQIDVEILADENGFTGEDAALALLSFIEKTPSKEQITADHVRRQTELWRQEWTTDEVVMTPQLAETLRVEADILAEVVGAQVVNGEALRQRVENSLSQIKVENLEQNIRALKSAYIHHAEEARQSAAQAFKDGVLAGQMNEGAKAARKQRAMAERALRAKEMQRRTLEELRARYKAKEERTKRLRDIRRMAKAGPDKIDVQYGDQIRALVQRFGMGGKSLAVKDPENLMPLSQFLAGVQSGIMEEAVMVPEWIVSFRAKPGKTAPWRQLSLEEFRELHEAITWIDHMGRTQKELIGRHEKQLVADVAGECAASQQSLKSRASIADYERKQVVKGAQHLLRRALAGITNLEYAFDAADGYRIAGKHGTLDGVHYKHIRGPLMEARRQELALQAEIQKQLETLLRPFKSRDRAKRWDMPGIPLPDAARREWGAMPWTYERVIMVALNMGNAGNKKALMAGYGWTQEHLDRITSSLTLEDWKMVQGIWDMVDSLYPRLNETYRKLNGLPMKKVEAAPLVAHGVVLKGGYFPLVADHYLSGKAAELVEEEMFKAHADAMFMKPKLADGFTKARTGSRLPPRLAMNVLTTHLARTTHYITHAVAIRDAVKLTQHPIFAASFVDKFGQEMHEQINPWLRHIARPTAKLLTGWEKALEYCRFMGTIQGLSLKLGTAAMQLTSVPASAQEIGWGAMTEGMTFVALNRSEAYETIRAMSPFMRDRSRSLERDIAANLDKYNPDRKTIRWEFGDQEYEIGWREFQQACFYPMTFADSITAYSTWWGAYKKKIGETGGDTQQAIDYADGVVIRAQSAAHSMNLTEAQRSNGLMKMATMFMTFTMNMQNRARFYLRGVSEGNISLAEYSRHVWNDLLLQPIIIALVQGALKGGDLDEPERYLKEIGFNLISGFPLLRDLQSYLEYGRSPSIVNSLAARGFEDVFKSAKYAGHIFVAEEEKRGDEFEKFIKATASAAGFFRGVPTQPVWTFIDGARDITQGKTSNPLRLFVKEEKKKKEGK